MTHADQLGVIIEEARGRVSPTELQIADVNGVAESTLRRVRDEAAKYHHILNVELGGSYAKGTWLARSNMDIDIYLKFKTDVGAERFEEIATKVGFDALRGCTPNLRYSEHPYVEARCSGIRINVVPYYNVGRGEWISAADRTSFHTTYMKEALTAAMRCDVRLLKSFLGANGLYGAEIAKNGFSGYVSEILVERFGSFENVIREFAGIQPGTIIGDATKEFETVITIIDPIDHNRNLAAAISLENMARFVVACRSFLKGPSLNMFDGTAGTISQKYWGNMLVVRFGFEYRAPDIIWGQAKKAVAAVAKQLQHDGFIVVRSKAHVEPDECSAYLFFLLNAVEIAPTYVHDGPEFFRNENTDTYIAKNVRRSEMVWMGPQGRIHALRRREHTSADTYVQNLLDGEAALLPDKLHGSPQVWIGRNGLDGEAERAGEELISTDGLFFYTS